MRFVLFSAQYAPTVGGVERYTQSLAQTLVGEGHEVSVVTSQLPGAPWREVDAGVEVLRVPSLGLLGGRLPVPLPTSRFRGVVAPPLRRQVDLAVVNTRFYPLSAWAVCRCARAGIPTVVLEHGTGYLPLGEHLVGVAGRVYEHLVAGWVRRFARRFYGVSQACAQWLRTFGVEADGVLYNAVDVDGLRREADEGHWDVRARFGLASDAPVVAYVGRLIPEKGVPELVEAMAAVRRRVPGATLVVAGDGPLRADLEERTPDGVVFAGPLPHAAAMSLVAQAQAFCMPTYYAEGFPTTLLEAAGLGTLVVATPVGGTAELIPSDEYGGLLCGHDAASVADALVRALTDDAWRASATAKASQRVAELFTWQATAAKLVQIAGELG